MISRKRRRCGHRSVSLGQAQVARGARATAGVSSRPKGSTGGRPLATGVALWDNWRMRRRAPPSRYRPYKRAAADPTPSNRGLPTRATVAIAIAGILATLIAAVASSAITGCQQSNLQDKNLKAQAAATDKVELRAVVDQATGAIERARQALLAIEGEFLTPRQQQLDSLDASIDAMGRPVPPLITRLGTDHRLTEAYVLAEEALSQASECWSTVLDAFVAHVRRGAHTVPEMSTEELKHARPYTNSERLHARFATDHAHQAIVYFTVTATNTAGTSLGTKQPPDLPAHRDLDALSHEVHLMGLCT